MSRKLVPSTSVTIVQARLLQPAYQAPGKWALFNSDDRRSYIAMGADKVPDVIALMESAAIGLTEGGDVVDEATAKHFERLSTAGLLTDRPADSARLPSFLASYHRAVTDYVFRNYYDDDWAERDRQLMTEYNKQWSVPDRLTRRSGPALELPNVGWEAIHSSPLNADSLSAILRFSLGPLGLIMGGDFGPWYRKTSPSGGAKHPTEAEVNVGMDIDGVPPGSYTYDVQKHQLVHLAPNPCVSVPSGAVRLVLRARVERPMWRYREVRSFRPVLIDVGHVAETVQLIAGACGITSRVREIRDCNLFESDLAEPAIVAIDLAGTSQDLVQPPAGEPHQANSDAKYLTNPAVVFTFTENGLTAETLAPMRSLTDCSLTQFWALTHALPSRRGDRDTSIEGIREATGATRSELLPLISRGLLIPETLGRQLYNSLDLWVKHGWYLSFLAHCATKSLPPAGPHEKLARQTLVGYSTRETTHALQVRRTTRSFSSRSVRRDAVDRMERAMTAGLPDYIDIFSLHLRVDDDGPSLSRWTGTSMVTAETELRAEDVRRVTIGQKSASEAAVSFWIVASFDFESGDYERRMVELGRIGQRACLAATVEQLGIFVTPALHDTLTLRAIGFEGDPAASAAYYIGIGTPRS